jgi:hypothetical protein
MKSIFALVAAACCLFRPEPSFAGDTAQQLVGAWKLVSWTVKFDGGDAVEPYGPNPKGRLVLTADGYWIIILSASNRKPAKTSDEKAALLDSLLAYSGRYTVDGDKITNHVDISSNEVFSGANRDQTRFFKLEGDKLTIRTPEIMSAVRPGQKAVGTNVFERE